MLVRLGNTAPHERVDRLDDTGRPVLDDDGVPVREFRPIEGDQVTTVHIPEGTSLVEALLTVTASGGVWAHHSSEPPAWVESDSSSFAAILADHYGCPIGEPDIEGGEA